MKTTGAEPVLDKAVGLLYSAGDEKLFYQLLRDFYRVHLEDVEKIKLALAEGDKSTACRLAHTLKSSSALIGALPLSSIALREEMALDTGATETPETCNSIITELEAAFADLIRELRGMLPEDDKKNVTAPLDKGKALALLQKMEPLLEDFNSAIFELRDEISYVLAPLGDVSEELLVLIDNIEFKKAVMLLAKIREMIISLP